MKKSIIYSLAVGIFLFTLHPVLAQATEPLVNPNTDKGQSDPKSEEILKKVAAIYKGYKTINASFTLTTTSLNKKPVVSKGNICEIPIFLYKLKSSLYNSIDNILLSLEFLIVL